MAAAVGIVEKIISIMFLIPSSMLSSISTFCAQNAGANLHKRAKKAIKRIYDPDLPKESAGKTPMISPILEMNKEVK